MKKKVQLLFICLTVTIAAAAQIVDPVKWQISQHKLNANTVELEFIANIEDGWHLYAADMPDDGPLPLEIKFETLTNAQLVGKIVNNSKAHEEFDNTFEMTVRFYEKTARFTQKITVSGDYTIAGYVKGQGCNEGACVPLNKDFEFTGQANTLNNEAIITKEATSTADTIHSATQTTAAVQSTNDVTPATVETDLYTPVIDQLNTFDEQVQGKTRSLWIVFLLGMLGGLVALITPCVWPIIPMTVSFFLKRSKDKNKGRRDAILYGLSIIVIYLTLGLIITAIFGPQALNSLSTNAFFNIFFFLLLVLFAVSFFGAFELTLPASWTSKLDAKAETTSGILSIMLMAFTLVLVSFSCTGPIIGTLLVEVSTTGEWLAPAIGMLGFAIALAVPFSLFAFFPTWLKSMPKSGGWLNSVKVVLGFLELALSLKFLSVADLAYGWHILDREVFVALWVVIFAMLGLYLLGKIEFPHDDKLEKISVTRFSLALISLSFAVYMLPGLWGAPLKAVSAFAPPLSTQDFNLYSNEVRAAYDNYEQGMAAAKQSGKPVIIDFSGFGCVNCRKMEASVWTDDKVADMLNNDYVLITLFVDDKTALPEHIQVNSNGQTRTLRTIGDKNSYLQSHKFGANAQPFYVLLDNDGKPLNSAYAFDEDAEKFVDFLKQGLKNYKTK